MLEAMGYLPWSGIVCDVIGYILGQGERWGRLVEKTGRRTKGTGKAMEILVSQHNCFIVLSQWAETRRPGPPRTGTHTALTQVVR